MVYCISVCNAKCIWSNGTREEIAVVKAVETVETMASEAVHVCTNVLAIDEYYYYYYLHCDADMDKVVISFAATVDVDTAGLVVRGVTDMVHLYRLVADTRLFVRVAVAVVVVVDSVESDD